jgi:hypothetical protein
MNPISDIIVHGDKINTNDISSKEILKLLGTLNDKLQKKNKQWKDVALLILANSKIYKNQDDSEEAIISGLTEYCISQDWFPSLIGMTVRSIFYGDSEEQDKNINDGIVFIAVINQVVNLIPVTHKIINSITESKGFKAANLVSQCYEAYIKKLSDDYGLKSAPLDVARSSTGILFTRGNRYLEASKDTDFDTTSIVTKGIINEHANSKIIGGCASNRVENQKQCLYYSENVGGRIEYKYSYSNAFIFSLIPHYSTEVMFLDHPFVNKGELIIEFAENKNRKGLKYRKLLKIGERDSIEYFTSKWHLTTKELDPLLKGTKSLAAEPKTFYFTIGSSKSVSQTIIWPNVPIVIENTNIGEDKKAVIKLIRPEPIDSNYYLMELEKNKLKGNCTDLVNCYTNVVNKPSYIISFLCESRKIIMEKMKINIEADTILSIPGESTKVGFYTNGEYSFGDSKSIGYHNISLTAAIFPLKELGELPADIFDKLYKNKNYKIFISHSSKDKSRVRELRDYMKSVFGDRVKFWIDEEELSLGDKLQLKIAQEIDLNADYLILFISKYSILSKYVNMELQWAIEREKEINRPFIIPIYLDRITNTKCVWSTEVMEYLLNIKHKDYISQEVNMVRGYSEDLVNEIINRIKKDLISQHNKNTY